MPQKYKIVSKNCVNSKWIARFLAKENQECCQCNFGCKIKVRNDRYEYIISEAEYWELKAKGLLE